MNSSIHAAPGTLRKACFRAAAGRVFIAPRPNAVGAARSSNAARLPAFFYILAFVAIIPSAHAQTAPATLPSPLIPTPVKMRSSLRTSSEYRSLSTAPARPTHRPRATQRPPLKNFPSTRRSWSEP